MRQNEVIISSSPQGITLVEAEFVLELRSPTTQDYKSQPDSGVGSVLQSPAQSDQTALSILPALDSKVNVGDEGVIITASGAKKPQDSLREIQTAPADRQSDAPPLPDPPTCQAPSLPQVSNKAGQPSGNVKATGCFGAIVDKIFGPGSR